MSVTILLFITMIVVIATSINRPKFAEDQVWVMDWEVENPFEKPLRDTIHILSVKGDYIQYRMDGVVYSDHKRCVIFKESRFIK